MYQAGEFNEELRLKRLENVKRKRRRQAKRDAMKKKTGLELDLIRETRRKRRRELSGIEHKNNYYGDGSNVLG